MGVRTLLTGILIFSLIAPVASAGWFSAEAVYEFYYDEDLLEEFRPCIFGPTPEVVYWRIMEEQGVPGVRVFEFFFYWSWQNTTGASHEHDWEFLCLFIDDNDIVYKCAYDEWHYTIGRTFEPRMYNDTHVGILLNDEYRNITIIERDLTVNLIKESLNYTTTYKYLDVEILGRAEVEVGFNSVVYDEPNSLFEQSWYGYKKRTAWKSVWRSIAVRVDKKTGWFGYGG